LIILDIQLPWISGLDVARALKADKQTRDIPIIGTTALPPDKEILPGETSCDAFLHKPISMSEFQTIVRFFLPP
jgi:two-component system, cell cycle response regulator DivK